MKDWFSTRMVAPHTWAISDHGCSVIYLVTGDERALLVDTGWGIGDLPGLVASLTSLPIIIVNTHAHPDHTFGNGQFGQVHLHQADIQMMGDTIPSLESRRWIAKNIIANVIPNDFEIETWATSRVKLIPIQDGHVFDLGNRTLTAISIPGHSPGSICLLDSRHRLLIVGDSVLPLTIALYFDECLPLGEFYLNLQRLQNFAGEFDVLLPAHVDLEALPQPKGLLEELINGIALILEGKLVGQPDKTSIGEGLRCDFGSCSITYRPDRM